MPSAVSTSPPSVRWLKRVGHLRDEGEALAPAVRQRRDDGVADLLLEVRAGSLALVEPGPVDATWKPP